MIAFLNDHLQILLLPVLLFCSAFFSGSEAALFSLNKAELFRMSTGNSRERLISRMMSTPQKILVTLLLCNLFVNTLISTISTDFLLEIFPSYGQYLTIAVATPLVIIFGEITPIVLAISVNTRISKIVINLIYVFHILMIPLRTLIISLISIFIKVFRIEFKDSVFITEGEIDAALDMGNDAGTLAPEETRFIKNVLKLSKKNAQSIMIPRNKIVALEYGSSIKDAIRLFHERPIVRVPVYRDNLDNIVGFLDSRLLVPYHHGYKKGKEITGKLIANAYHFPSSKDLSSLLSDFLEHKIQMAVVVDEYGGTMGIVTLSGIISEVMGDEFTLSAEEQKKDIKLTENEIVINGDMLVVDFNSEFSENLETTESETIAGYIIEKLERIPAKGDSIAIQNHSLVVRKVFRNRIESVAVEKIR